VTSQKTDRAACRLLYSPRGNTVVRAGFGIFYGGLQSEGNGNLGANFPCRIKRASLHQLRYGQLPFPCRAEHYNCRQACSGYEWRPNYRRLSSQPGFHSKSIRRLSALHDDIQLAYSSRSRPTRPLPLATWVTCPGTWSSMALPILRRAFGGLAPTPIRLTLPGSGGNRPSALRRCQHINSLRRRWKSAIRMGCPSCNLHVVSCLR